MKVRCSVWVVYPRSPIYQNSMIPSLWCTALHYSDVIMGEMASEITSRTIFHSTVYSGADQRKHQTGLCAGNSPVTGEFPAQMSSNAGNVSIWWRHHEASDIIHGCPIFKRVAETWLHHTVRYQNISPSNCRQATGPTIILPRLKTVSMTLVIHLPICLICFL